MTQFSQLPSSSSSQASAYQSHSHSPTLVLSEKRVEIWAGSMYSCKGKFYRFDCVINLTGSSSKPYRHKIPNRFKRLMKYREVDEFIIDWPDMGAPPLPFQFWKDLLQEFRSRGKSGKPFKVLIFCVGGHGRTGTALTALYMIQNKGKIGAIDAMTSVRESYCSHAVESESQKTYLKGLHDFLSVNSASNKV